MDLQQFKHKFVDDALELLNSLDDILLNLEKDATNREHIEHVFRVMHTLKGTSGMYGFDIIAEITHNLESLYDLVRDNKLIVNDELIEVTFATVDIIRSILGQSDDKVNDKYERTCKMLTDKINQIAQKAGSSIKQKGNVKKTETKVVKRRSWNIVFTPDESIISRNINIFYTLQDLLQLGEYRITSDLTDEEREVWTIILVTDKPKDDIQDALIFVEDYCKITQIADFDVLNENELDERDNYINQLSQKDDFFELTNVETQEEVNIQKSDAIKSDVATNIKHATKRITVDAEKLDTLIYLVSELVTSKSELLLSIEKEDNEKIKAVAENIDKLSKLFRDNALSIRLVSLQDLLNRFRWLVRDLAKQLNKNVDFEIMGEDTELDKSIIEAISEPIMHLIRNCIDHGIETREERTALNKSETGIVKFVAFKQGSFVFLQISDDGKGIDKQKILQKAISRNLISEHQLLTDKEIYDLIFIPGFFNCRKPDAGFRSWRGNGHCSQQNSGNSR